MPIHIVNPTFLCRPSLSLFLSRIYLKLHTATFAPLHVIHPDAFQRWRLSFISFYSEPRANRVRALHVSAPAFWHWGGESLSFAVRLLIAQCYIQWEALIGDWWLSRRRLCVWVVVMCLCAKENIDAVWKSKYARVLDIIADLFVFDVNL